MEAVDRSVRTLLAQKTVPPSIVCWDSGHIGDNVGSMSSGKAVDMCNAMPFAANQAPHCPIEATGYVVRHPLKGDHCAFVISTLKDM